MADKDQNPENGPNARWSSEDHASDPATPAPSEPASEGNPEPEAASASSATGSTEEGFEGPDVETSLSDVDLDFLSGQTSAEELAAERLADLQRVTAEYANYRKRTEANREVERERAVGDTVMALLPVLDDLDRAEKHGDLEGEGPFVTIAAKLRATVERLGATPFGAAGEPFDHNIHEAVFQQPNPEVTVETIAEVVETGYTLGSSLVRVAKVVVFTPSNG